MVSTFVSLCSYIIKIVVIFAVYFRTVVRVLVQFSPKSPELRTGPNWTNTSGSSDRTELDYAARASNWTELDQPPRLARTMVRSGPSRALALTTRVHEYWLSVALCSNKRPQGPNKYAYAPVGAFTA